MQPHLGSNRPVLIHKYADSRTPAAGQNRLVRREKPSDWDQLASQKIIHLTSVKGFHTKCFTDGVSVHQCQLDVSGLKDLVLPRQHVLGQE